MFLCHAQEDKPKVRELYEHLSREAWIDPWLDEEKLLPGQKWNEEIIEAIRDAHVIVVCLSKQSVAKEGYVQREINHALDISEEKPEHTIFIIPLLFNDCDIPYRLREYQYHWVGESSADPYTKLLKALELRASTLGLKTPAGQITRKNDSEELDFYSFVKIAVAEVPYTFYVSKYPITNAQYERFVSDIGFYTNKLLWSGFPSYNEDCIEIDQWGNEGWNWRQSKRKSMLDSDRWDDHGPNGAKRYHPVVVNWYEANAYSKWLIQNWENLQENIANPDLKPKQIRLPLELEWVAAAGGENPMGRYPWDRAGRTTKEDKEIARRANVNGNIGHTTPVNIYLRGASDPYGVMDMAGNVWEWQANFYDKKHVGLALRGGAWNYYPYGARVSHRYTYLPDDKGVDNVGFRVVALPRNS